jgi:hypothetical protein
LPMSNRIQANRFLLRLLEDDASCLVHEDEDGNDPTSAPIRTGDSIINKKSPLTGLSRQMETAFRFLSSYKRFFFQPANLLSSKVKSLSIENS